MGSSKYHQDQRITSQQIKKCQGENTINSYNTVLLSPKHVINLLQQVPVPQDKCGQQRIHEIHQRSGHLLKVQLPAAHVK
jgi:hypothetical protein